MRFFLLFLVLPFFAYAEWDQLFSQGEDPSLFHHVNVITGNLNLSIQDTVVQGAKPLSLFRTYTSSGALERTPEQFDLALKDLRGGWLIQGGWSVFPHANLLIYPSIKMHHYKAYVAEENGFTILYSYSHTSDDDKHVIFLKPELSSPSSSGALSGRTNPENNLLQINTKKGEAVLFLSNGGMRFYQGKPFNHSKIPLKKRFYTLNVETLPSQHHLEYSYDDKTRLTHVTLKNPSKSKTYSWIHFDLFDTKSPFHFQIKTSDGKRFGYRSLTFKDRDYLCRTSSNCRPIETLNYVEGRKGIGARIDSLSMEEKIQFKVDYYLPPSENAAEFWAKHPDKKKLYADKVKALEAPWGENSTLIPIAQFSYSHTYTDVHDVDHLLTRYHHDTQKLLHIEYFDKNNNLHSWQRFCWDGKQLSGKVMLDRNNGALFSKTFRYDSFGNVIEEILWGNLTGHVEGPFSLNGDGTLNGAENYRKRYEYLPRFNLPTLEEEEEGPTYKYFYKPGTDLLTLKLTCDKDRILIRDIFLYDEDNILIAEIKDDGVSLDPNNLSSVSERHIKRYEIHSPVGLPVAMTESYLDLVTHQEVLLRKVCFGYNPRYLICKEVVYDANEVKRYEIDTNYNKAGRIKRKTTPLGQVNTYKYDDVGNLLEIKEVGSLKKTYTYDGAKHPLTCQEICTNGQIKNSLMRYDTKGRLLSQTDHKGNTTFQHFDEFGRCLRTDFPQVKDENGQPYTPFVQFSYDVLGNMISHTTPKGETTSTLYNTLRKPTKIIYPDGTKINHTYNKNGSLAKTIYSDQTTITYTYDLFQRMTSKKIHSADGSLLSKEEWKYNTFHLLSYTDAQGLTTIYTYDGAGRKTAEQAGSLKKTYLYDALGFLCKTTEGDISYIQLHDVEGNVIQEWIEDSNGHKENEMTFFYDEENRKIKAIRLTSQKEAIDLFSYDHEGRLTSHEDPLGNVTQFVYSEEENDLGQRILHKATFDPLGNATVDIYDAQDRLVCTEKKDPQGYTVFKEEWRYDLSGNKAKRISTIYKGRTPFKTITVSWEHNSMGKVIKQQEGDHKITLFEYHDPKGRLSKKILPDGRSLSYFYDGLDRLVKQFSSDGKIYYQYFYARGNKPSLAIDLVRDLTFTCAYNDFGQLVEEIQPDWRILHWNYDVQGRCTLFTLPDQSSIAYSYEGGHLIQVSRQDKDGHLLYEHKYRQFDPNGHVQEESLINELGTVFTTRDLLERPSLERSEYFTHQVTYGPSSLVTSLHNSLFGTKEYSYDALNQITRESDLTYDFDSLGNPTYCQTNDCNELLHLSYDQNGNPIEHHEVSYSYDALGRLTTITCPEGKQIRYTYDPFSRLYRKEIYQNSQRENVFYYLYDQEKEIGLLNENYEVVQLKVLGLGLKGDIGAAIAIELDGVPYAPLHDFTGTIIALIAPDGHLAESYDFTAFGQERSFSSPLCPWRFCSKRHEEGFVFFGKRFYDPELGRWLTPDPAGFIDSANLYLFVLNSPLNRLDLFGLSSEWNLSNTRIEFPYTLFPEYLFGSLSQMPCKIIGPDGTQADGTISCGNLHKLQFTPEERNTNKVNLLDHLAELIPNNGALIGVITAQNGINNSFQDFLTMCGSITDKIPEDTLFIGIYNPSKGFFKDGYRAIGEAVFGKETKMVSLTRQFMTAIVENVHKISPHLFWLHVSHSEAGGIKYLCIDGMTPEQKALLKQHLLSLSLAPAHPIPRSFCFQSINIYSKMDFATGGLGLFHRLTSNDYEIKFVPSLTKLRDMNGYFNDHGFLLDTQQNSLNEELKYIRTKIGFYDTRTR